MAGRLIRLHPEPPKRQFKATLHIPEPAFERLEQIGRDWGISTTRAIETVLTQMVPRLAISQPRD